MGKAMYGPVLRLRHRSHYMTRMPKKPYCPQAMDQVIQVVGAVLILAAFAAAQFDLLTPHSRLYLVLNLVGAATLTVLAWYGQQWGFLLLEAVWTLVSGWGLLRVLRGQTPAT